MATLPTKRQQQARDRLADALLAITEAARLDGRSALDSALLNEIAGRIVRVSSAFGLTEIIARALEMRGQALGLAGSTVELLTLVDSETIPVEMLLLDDEEFRAMVAKIEDEWSDV